MTIDNLRRSLELEMAKKKSTNMPVRSTASSVLTQEDAKQYRSAAAKYEKKATSSKTKAQDTLKSLGIYTGTGKISKKYG